MSLPVSSKRDLIRVLDGLLVPHGYVRAKDDWNLDNGECVAIIGLGKSFYGGQFALGIDILLKELRPDLLPFPPRHLCHFRGYAVEFLMPDPGPLKAALDLENGLTATERFHTIGTGVIDYAVPFLMPLNSKQALAQAYHAHQDFECYCRLDLKMALERHGFLSHQDLKLDL
jgi:hypothetical protein